MHISTTQFHPSIPSHFSPQTSSLPQMVRYHSTRKFQEPPGRGRRGRADLHDLHLLPDRAARHLGLLLVHCGEALLSGRDVCHVSPGPGRGCNIQFACDQIGFKDCIYVRGNNSLKCCLRPYITYITVTSTTIKSIIKRKGNIAKKKSKSTCYGLSTFLAWH